MMKKLASDPPPNKHPRFRYVSAKKKTYVWMELRGATLLFAEGKIGSEDDVRPETRIFDDEKSAKRERDAVTARLVAAGYTLEPFDKR
jgi:hypothetical protein